MMKLQNFIVKLQSTTKQVITKRQAKAQLRHKDMLTMLAKLKEKMQNIIPPGTKLKLGK